MSRVTRLAHELVQRQSTRVTASLFLLTPDYSWVQASEYEPFRERVERAGRDRQFAFASWFPEGGRVYLPFEMTTETEGQEGVDKDIKEILEEAGYTIVDYRKGLAANAQGRQQRIGALLQNFYKKEIKELEAEREDFSEMMFQTKQRRLREYWIEAISLFQNSVYRAHAGTGQPGYLVVISSDIHDIGGMSTGRSWTSCTNLESGMHRKDVYCEIRNGGFVAYLIKESDREIDNPLARISIKRFDNKQGQSLAVPEETVYGNEIEGFREIVQRWLDSKQGHVTPGVYFRRGGEQSDSLSGMVIKSGQTGPQLLKMLRFGLSKGNWNPQSRDGWNPRRRPYVDAAIDGIVSGKNRFNPKLLQKFAEIVFDPKNRVRSDKISEFAMRFPDYVTQEGYDQFLEYAKDRFDRINPRFKEGRVKKAYDLLEGGLDIDNPALGLNTDQPPSYGELGKVQKLLESSNSIKPLPEQLIRQHVKFGRDVIARFGFGGVTRNIISALVHQLAMGEADTPTVVRFYEELLPYFDQLGIDSMGWALSRLGINGTPFLPFLREKLQQVMEDKKSWNPERRIEQMKYIIDSIENGSGRSERYQFFF
jgi:hypothetical protein